MGFSYQSRNGSHRSDRKVKPPCPETCRYKCTFNFTADDRQQIHQEFWQLSREQKYDYYNRMVERINCKRKRIKDAPRTFTYVYHFIVRSTDVRMQVCKVFFHTTLDLSLSILVRYFIRINKFNKNSSPSSVPAQQHQTQISEKCWKRTKRDWSLSKERRELGLSYVRRDGTIHPERQIKPPCSDSCRHKCALNISTEERQRIHREFWLLSHEQKLDFYQQTCDLINDSKPHMRDKYAYHFMVTDSDDNCRRVQVCLQYFTNTLNVSISVVFRYFRKIRQFDPLSTNEASASFEHTSKIVNLRNRKLNRDLRESGLSYRSRDGKERPDRQMKAPCLQICRYKCTLHFDEEQRLRIHQFFWTLSRNEKHQFYDRSIKRVFSNRARVRATYQYFLDAAGISTRVCQFFYTNTLGLSPKVLFTYFRKKYTTNAGIEDWDENQDEDGEDEAEELSDVDTKDGISNRRSKRNIDYAEH